MAAPLQIVLFLAVLAAGVAVNIPPVVYVPGFTASDLLFKRVQAQSKFPFCKNNSGWGLLWPLAGFDFKTNETTLCWLEALETKYDPATGSFGGNKGIEVEMLGFGTFVGTSGGPKIVSKWKEQGWVPGKTIFAAPFDWRVPSAGLESYFQKLKALIEHAYSVNGNQRVVLLAVSFGPQVALSFLHRMTQEWKDQHIEWFVAESPVWSGAPIALMSLISGVPLSGNVSEDALYRAVALRISSLPWLFPRAGTNSSVTWTSDEVLVATPIKNYTAQDYVALFRDLGLDEWVPGLQATVEDADLARFDAPMVNTLVTYGIDLNTSGFYRYGEPFVPNPNVVPAPPVGIKNMSETGDGVVPLRSSLRSAHEWAAPMAAGGKRMLHWSYPGQAHAYCLVPEAGPCFMDIVNFIRNGTIPPPHAHAKRSPPKAIPEIDAIFGWLM